MLGKTHQLIGFTTVYSAALYFNVTDLNAQTIIAGVILSSIGSLTPDLDDSKNKLYTLLPIGQKTLSGIGGKLFGEHRTISHSLVGILIFGWLSKFLIYKIPEANGFENSLLWYSFFISFLAHLGADALTKDGIPLFWPINLRIGFPPFRALRIKTGGFVEIFIIDALCFIILIGITSYWWERVIKLF